MLSSIVLVFAFGLRAALSSLSLSEERFDFVIVGGGTAGCALANRLSSNGKFSVLLLEAGGIPPEFMRVPALAKQNERIPQLTFQYQSVPQKRAALANKGIVPAALGRVLGGTSAINYMMYNRGSPEDYNQWANVTMDDSWKYSNMLPYFKRAETYIGEFPSDQHGTDGPITVSHQKYSPGREVWYEAAKELGYFPIHDPNGPQEISFTPVEFARKFGRRVSSFNGYLQPIMTQRPNLRVVTYAYATKILFEGTKTIGVKYTVNGTDGVTEDCVAFIDNELILSAGSYGSATLLMRSGVGPLEELASAKIPLVRDLPVGENLQEHPALQLHFILNNKSLAFDPPTDLTPENYKLFQEYGIGPYTSVAGYGSQAFLASPVAERSGQSHWADIQLAMTAVTLRHPVFVNLTTAPWETSIIMNLYLARPKSRGTVRLNPNNIYGPPLIDFNYLDDPLDEEVILSAIDKTLAIFERTHAYKKRGARYPPESAKGCNHLKFRSEPYWRCYIRETLITGNHPTSTCSMNTVVDSSLRVIGIQHLRVVDASIMPYITNTNIHAAVYAIAEKASDAILQHWTSA